MMVISVIIASLFACWRAGRRSRFFLHRFQLSGYKRPAFMSTLKGPVLDLRVRPSHLVGASGLLIFLFFSWFFSGHVCWNENSYTAACPRRIAYNICKFIG